MASMCFGYKTIDKNTGVESGMGIRNTACWAPLKLSQDNLSITEITWVPEKGHSKHIKLLLPLLFKGVDYEEIHKTENETKFPNGNPYAIRFFNLGEQYRVNFMFRMFIIRNIDRDDSCTRSFEYMVAYGCNPLKAAAVAANIDIKFGGWGRDNNITLGAKGYACCFSRLVTVADVNAFARDPSALRNKADWKFKEGRGFGYQPEMKNGRIQYDGNAVSNACTGYKPSRPQFASQNWDNNKLNIFLSKLFKDNHFLSDEVAQAMSKVKVVR